MQYMLLVHHDENVFTKMDETIQQQLLDESIQLTHQLNASGQYVSASPLHPAATASVVRVRGGRETVTDGPFAETKEQLAGYFLINARDLNEAVRIATRIPGARIGTVEVRAVKEVQASRGSRMLKMVVSCIFSRARKLHSASLSQKARGRG